MDDDTNYKLMAPKLKRTCLSARSAISGRPNLDSVPLGAKLPMVPGNKINLYTARLGQRLHQTSCDFDRTYPSDVYISNEYRCLHDPHLRHYFARRPVMAKRLQGKGFTTSENKVLCSLKEYNLYRQYLKHLSIESHNKVLRETYEQQLKVQRSTIAAAIEARQKDPLNPITQRINKCKSIRYRLAKEAHKKGQKIIQMAVEEKERRLKQRQEETEYRIQVEIRREDAREKQKKEKEIKQNEERSV